MIRQRPFAGNCRIKLYLFDQTEMSQTVGDAILAQGRGDEAGMLLGFCHTIAHTNAVANRPEHGNVIGAVAKGEGVCLRYIQML